jgi:protein-disulfide isomerase
VLTAAAIVAVLAIASGGDDDGPQGLGGGEQLAGADKVESVFDGIPQEGMRLGDPGAPVTVVEFVDLQCPFCASFAREALPEIVERYVRPGRVRLEMRLLDFVGRDSRRAAAMAIGAAEQDKAWQFSELLFQNQGRENTGYVTPSYLRRIAAGVEGLDVDRAIADAETPATAARLAEDRRLAAQVKVTGTPDFYGARTGRKLKQLGLSGLSAAELSAYIDELLGLPSRVES